MTFTHDNEIQAESKRRHAKLSLAFWGCTLGSTALSVLVAALLTSLPDFESNRVLRKQVNLALTAVTMGSIAVGATLTGDKRRFASAVAQGDQVLAHNAAGHVNLATAALRSVHSTVQDLALNAATVTGQTLAPYFDWARLQDNDLHPTIAVFGRPGSGKSVLLRYLVRHVIYAKASTAPEITAFDSFGALGDYGFNSTPYKDHNSVIDKMSLDIDTMLARTERTDTTKLPSEQWSPLAWIVEELPALTATVKAFKGKAGLDTLTQWVTLAATTSRKLNGRVVFVSNNITAESMGVDTDTRNNCTAIFVGKGGVAKAIADSSIFGLGRNENREIREALKTQTDKLQYPALVYVGGDWYWSEVPQLDKQGDPIGQASAPTLPPPTPDFSPTIPDFVPQTAPTAEAWVKPTFPRFAHSWIQGEGDNRTWDTSNLPRAPRVSDLMDCEEEEELEEAIERPRHVQIAMAAKGREQQAWEVFVAKSKLQPPGKSGHWTYAAISKACAQAGSFKFTCEEVLATWELMDDWGHGRFVDGFYFVPKQE